MTRKRLSHVVLCADKKQLAADILDLYEFLLNDRHARPDGSFAIW